MGQKLSPEEAARLGLPMPKTSKKLSAEEAQSLGLPMPKARAPAPTAASAEVSYRADPTAEHKVYSPSSDTTEVIKDFKLVRKEPGNTTGYEPAKSAPLTPPQSKYDPMSFKEAVLRKYAEGGFSGATDEATGAGAMSLANTPGQYLRLPDGSEVPMSSDLDQYRGGRDMDRQLNKQADEKLGKWGVIPQTAGAISQYLALAPMFKAAGKALTPATEGMGAIRTAANVAGAEAVLPSFMSAVGNAQSDLTKGEVLPFLGETALSTATGTGTAGLMGGGVGAAQVGADKVGFTDWLKRKAAADADAARTSRDNWFFRILGTKKGDFKKMDHLDNEGDIADYAFKNKMVGRTTTEGDLLESAAAKRQETGARIGAIKDQADAVATPDQLPSDANTLNQLYAMKEELAKSSSGQKMLPKIQAEIESIEAAIQARGAGQQGPADPRVSFRANEGNKTGYDETIDWGADKFAQKAAKDARTGFKVETEKKLAGVDPKLAEDFSAAKSDMGNAASIEALARDAVAATKARNKVGLGTKILMSGGLGGTAGGMSGSPTATLASLATGAGIGAASHAIDRYGPAFMATRANNRLMEALARANANPFEAAAGPLSAGAREVSQEEVQRFMEWLASGGK